MDWIHLHLALNHIPVLGTAFLAGLLLWAWWRRQSTTLRFCLWLFVALASVSIAIKFTGDFAAERARQTPGLDKQWIDRHEDAADRASTGVFLMGLSAATSLFLARKGKTPPGWSLGILACLALATFMLMARTANFGGHIRHPEIRPMTAPAP